MSNKLAKIKLIKVIIFLSVVIFVTNVTLLFFFYKLDMYGSNHPYNTAELLFNFHKSNIGKDYLKGLASDTNQIKNKAFEYYKQNPIILTQSTLNFLDFNIFEAINKNIVYRDENIVFSKKINIFKSTLYSLYNLNIVNEYSYLPEKPTILIFVKPTDNNEEIFVFIQNHVLYFLPKSVLT